MTMLTFGIFFIVPKVCDFGCTEEGKEKQSQQERREEERRAWRQCRIARAGRRGVNINADSAVVAQQVIMITTCSLGGSSLIWFPSTYPS